MADIKRISNKNVINNGNVDSNLSMSDILLCQHVAGDNNDYQVSLAQAQAVPYGTCTSAAGEDKVVNLVNYPSSFTAQVGTKILVKFTNANTKGHVSDNTSVDLTAGGVTKPIAAQGKTIGAGAIIAGGIYELTLTPDYWNIDQNVREVTSDYTILTDNTFVYNTSQTNNAIKEYVIYNLSNITCVEGIEIDNTHSSVWYNKSFIFVKIRFTVNRNLGSWDTFIGFNNLPKVAFTQYAPTDSRTYNYDTAIVNGSASPYITWSGRPAGDYTLDFCVPRL